MYLYVVILGEVEDEFHFLVYCEYYNEEREDFINSIIVNYKNINSLSNCIKLQTLFNFEPRKLSRYVSRILNKGMTRYMYNYHIHAYAKCFYY